MPSRLSGPFSCGLLLATAYPGPCPLHHLLDTEGLRSVVTMHELGVPGWVLPVHTGVSDCEGGFLGFLKGTRVNGQPSPNDLAKAASSDGVGPHSHGDFGLHEHGEPTFSDAEVAMLEANGLHVDRHHGGVQDADGFLLSPGTVGAMLSEARQGTLKADDGAVAGASVTKGIWSGNAVMKAPGE